MKILIPEEFAPNTHLSLPAGTTLATWDPSRPLSDDDLDAEVFIEWYATPAWLQQNLPRLKNLRWIQSLFAGPDNLRAVELPADVVVTTGKTLHDATVSEQALALTLALLRRLPYCDELKRQHSWDKRLFAPTALRPEGRVMSLIGAHVTIWGFGSIGGHLARILTALGAEVTGVARSDGERHGYRTVCDVEAVLPTTDVLIMILPTHPTTAGALSRERLAMLPKESFVVNVGRGSTIDEAALIDALRAGQLAGAGLDVMAHEPLPADDPLWDAPNVILTPHVAGGRPLGFEKVFEHNLHALLTGGEFLNRATL